MAASQAKCFCDALSGLKVRVKFPGRNGVATKRFAEVTVADANLRVVFDYRPNNARGLTARIAEVFNLETGERLFDEPNAEQREYVYATLRSAGKEARREEVA